MAEIITQCCDICNRPMERRIDARPPITKYMDKFGLSIAVAHSTGGWGYAQPWVEFSGEICKECFDALSGSITTLKDQLFKLRKESKYNSPVWNDFTDIKTPDKVVGPGVRGERD